MLSKLTRRACIAYGAIMMEMVPAPSPIRRVAASVGLVYEDEIPTSGVIDN